MSSNKVSPDSSTGLFRAVHHIQERLDDFRPRKRWWRRWVKRSAVALLLRDGAAGPEVLMIKRAEREGDRWSGHMAFPGGRMETDDSHGRATAERETREEIGVDPQRFGRCVGRLSDMITRPHSGYRPMVITPYVYVVKRIPEPKPNYEVAEVIWVPLNFLADHDNRAEMAWSHGRLKLKLPVYYYREKQIWGLSLAMLDELISLFQ